MEKLTREEARWTNGGGKSFWDCVYGFGMVWYNVDYSIGNALGYVINSRRML